MSQQQTTISLTWRVNGAPADVTSAELADPAGAFGVRRLDTGAVVVAANTALVRVAQGVYSYSFADPAPGLVYHYYVKVAYLGATYYQERNQSAAPDLAQAGYCTLSEARTIAGSLPGLASFKAADDAAATAAILKATIDIDAAGPYQGRAFDPIRQLLKFPRVAYGAAGGRPWAVGNACGLAADTVWDWDPVANAAVVPLSVKRACVYQADAILAGKLYKALDDQALGIASQSAGSISVSYRDPAAILAAMGGGASRLCGEAAQLLKDYRLKQGMML